MATHEQTFLGPVFEQMERDGLIRIEEGENSYWLATEFVRLATEAGVLIDADRACSECADPDETQELAQITVDSGET